MIYGYVRTSTKEQNEDRQIKALNNYGVDRIKIDKSSGNGFNRPEYQLLKNELLRNGDTLVIKELDRLGRNMDQIKVEWRELEEAGINIVVLDNPILNTKGKSDLEKKLISNIVFELLSYMAEKERVKIKQRQAEGIAAMPINTSGKKYSKRTGRVTGRPITREFPKDWNKIYKLYKEGNLKAKQIQSMYSIPKSTFYYMLKKYEGNL